MLDDACLVASLLLAGIPRHGRPDVLIGHNTEGALAAGLVSRALGIPTLYLRHTDFGLELGARGRLAGAFGRATDSLAATLSTRSIRLGLDLQSDALPPPGDPDEQPIAPGDGTTLYYEGNEDDYQNPLWLDAAVTAARHTYPDVRLLRSPGPGSRPARADLGLVPRSLPGGFPMKLLAYQLAGLATVCVASGAPGVVDGLDAFVVPGRGSPETFARRVAEALGDPEARGRVAARARERALARCHPARVAERLESVLADLQAAGSARPPYIERSSEENVDPPP